MKTRKILKGELKSAIRRNEDKWLAIITAIVDYANDKATPKEEAAMWRRVLQRLRADLAAEDAEQAR